MIKHITWRDGSVYAITVDLRTKKFKDDIELNKLLVQLRLHCKHVTCQWRHQFDWDTIQQLCLIKCLDVIRKYDGRNGVSFKTFLNSCLYNYIRNLWRYRVNNLQKFRDAGGIVDLYDELEQLEITNFKEDINGL